MAGEDNNSNLDMQKKSFSLINLYEQFHYEMSKFIIYLGER